MQVYKYVNTITVAAGAGSGNTHNIMGGICRKLFVEAETATTRFKVNLTDDTSSTIRSYDYRTGKLDDEKPLILQGVNTVNITNATANEDFTVKIWVEE